MDDSGQMEDPNEDLTELQIEEEVGERLFFGEILEGETETDEEPELESTLGELSEQKWMC